MIFHIGLIANSELAHLSDTQLSGFALENCNKGEGAMSTIAERHKDWRIYVSAIPNRERQDVAAVNLGFVAVITIRKRAVGYDEDHLLGLDQVFRTAADCLDAGYAYARDCIDCYEP